MKTIIKNLKQNYVELKKLLKEHYKSDLHILINKKADNYEDLAEVVKLYKKNFEKVVFDICPSNTSSVRITIKLKGGMEKTYGFWFVTGDAVLIMGDKNGKK